MSVRFARLQRRQPQRRAFDGPRLRLRIGEDRDRPSLDDERQRGSAEHDEDERGAERDQRRRIRPQRAEHRSR